MLFRLSYRRSGQIAFCFGAYIGICLDIIYLNGTIQKINVTKNFKKAFVRILLVLLVSSVFLIPRYVDKYYNRAVNWPMIPIFVNFMSFFVISVLFFSYLKVLFTWLRLVK